MTRMAAIKICGVTRAEDAIAAASLGATHIGLVFYAKSPRCIDVADAEALALDLRAAAVDGGFAAPSVVGLFVDAGETLIAEAAPFLTHVQLHGRESPERCADLAAAFGLPIIKAVSVAGPDDVAAAAAYEAVVDMLLFDAKPPPASTRPGGNGVTFDWSLASKWSEDTPFLLAGGLTDANVGTAVAACRGSTAFAGVDVSSGVESSPGVKDRMRLQSFVRAAKSAFG